MNFQNGKKVLLCLSVEVICTSYLFQAGCLKPRVVTTAHFTSQRHVSLFVLYCLLSYRSVCIVNRVLEDVIM